MSPASLEESLGIRFRNLDLLREALTHSSAADPQAGRPSNQRLEFLGDAVLQLLVGERLFAENPAAREGELTTARIRLVRGSALARIAEGIDLGTAIRLSDSARAYGAAAREAVLEDCLEALFGAVYLDGGLDAARSLRDRLFAGEDFRISADAPAEDNPKGALQEILQARPDGAPPVYEVIATEGPPHERVFTAIARIEGAEVGRGTGASKKAAEANAAEDAIRRMLGEDPHQTGG